AGDGTTYRISSNQDSRDSEQEVIRGRARAISGRQRFKTSLTIQVPKHSGLRIDNRYGNVTVRDLAGHEVITNRYGRVDLTNIEGEVEVTNRFKEVKLRDIRGAVTVTGQYGDVQAEFLEPPEKDIAISMRFGDVRLQLPSSAPFAVEARTSFGDFKSEFPGIV